MLLDTAKAGVLVVDGLPMGFLDLWCRIVVEAGGAFHRLMVGDIEGVRFACGVEVVAAGGEDCFGGASARMEALASVPVGEGSRLCTGALLVLLFLC
jgi:hypothetical protein